MRTEWSGAPFLLQKSLGAREQKIEDGWAEERAESGPPSRTTKLARSLETEELEGGWLV